MISSIGRVISLSTSSGEDETYGMEISTSSEEKSGRNASGNRCNARNPRTIILTIIMSMEIGLFTENSEIFIS
jgi:hypothetical protein